MAWNPKQYDLWQPWKSSGVKSADATIKNSSGLVGGVIIQTDGTNDATVALKDGGSGGTVLIQATCPAADFTLSLALPRPGILFATNIYLDLTGTGAKATVFYR